MFSNRFTFGSAGNNRAIRSLPFSSGVAAHLVSLVLAQSLINLVRIGGAEPSPPADAVYSVGIAKQDISPSYPVRLNGFAFRKTESEGTSQPLWARALAIGTDKQEPIVLVTLDSLGIRSTLVDEVHRRLAEHTKLAREHLIVTFTHTHSAPKVNGASDNIFAEPIPPTQLHLDQYTEELIVDLVAVIQEALAEQYVTEKSK